MAMAEGRTAVVVVNYNFDRHDVAGVREFVVDKADDIVPDASLVDLLVIGLGDGTVDYPASFNANWIRLVVAAAV